MPEDNNKRRVRFWRIVGLSILVALGIALLYVFIARGFNNHVLSDALCISAAVLGVGAAIPFLADAGRGLALTGKMGSDEETRNEALRVERRRRETGMTITFALALAAFLIGLMSLIISLL